MCMNTQVIRTAIESLIRIQARVAARRSAAAAVQPQQLAQAIEEQMEVMFRLLITPPSTLTRFRAKFDAQSRQHHKGRRTREGSRSRWRGDKRRSQTISKCFVFHCVIGPSFY